MSGTKTRWRFFLAHQDANQEAWFEEQARQGWHLAKPGIFGFTFRQATPEASRYRLDYQMLRGEKRAEYLALFRDAGWEFLGESMNRYYFRAGAEALAPEIHTDPESHRERIRRELRLIVFLAALNGWNTFFLATQIFRDKLYPAGRSAYVASGDWIFPPAVVLTALATVLLVWCAWKLYGALKKDD